MYYTNFIYCPSFNHITKRPIDGANDAPHATNSSPYKNSNFFNNSHLTADGNIYYGYIYIL